MLQEEFSDCEVSHGQPVGTWITKITKDTLREQYKDRDVLQRRNQQEKIRRLVYGISKWGDTDVLQVKFTHRHV